MKLLLIAAFLMLLVVLWWKHNARKGRAEENAITWFFQALEFILFRDNPKIKEVRERNLLTASAYFFGYNKRHHVGALNLNDLKYLAVEAEKRYDQRADTLLYFVLYLKAAKEIRMKNSEWRVDVNDTLFKAQLSKLDVKKIASVVANNLKETVPRAGFVSASEMFVKRNPNWYELQFTD